MISGEYLQCTHPSGMRPWRNWFEECHCIIRDRIRGGRRKSGLFDVLFNFNVSRAKMTAIVMIHDLGRRIAVWITCGISQK